MNIFPNTPEPAYPFSLSHEFKTLVTDFESGKEQRRQIWSFPKRSLSLKYDGLIQSEINTLRAFFVQQRGSLEPFWYLWPLKNPDGTWRTYTEEYVARGNGTQTIFELPSKETDQGSLTVYVAGVSTGVTFLSSGGDAGVDRVQFSSAPTNGDLITADFTGQLRLRMRFKEDKCAEEMTEHMLFSAVMEMLEVRV